MKWKITHSWWDSYPRVHEYMPNALTGELRELDTFEYIVWDTDISGDIAIMFVNVNTGKVKYLSTIGNTWLWLGDMLYYIICT